MQYKYRKPFQLETKLDKPDTLLPFEVYPDEKIQLKVENPVFYERWFFFIGTLKQQYAAVKVGDKKKYFGEW